VLRTAQPDVVLVYSSAMAQYVAGRIQPTTGLVVDFVDADAEKWRAYASSRSPLQWIFAREAETLVQFERRVLQAAAAGVLVSETERRLLARSAPDGAAKLHVVPNGVDTDYFQSWPVCPEGDRIVFCGRMDYLPNIDGAQWFARHILPRVRRRRPQAVFSIVGAKPTSAVLALQRLPGVEVVGGVPDVRPYLAQAAVVVAPLRIARGIQNKVLEGMAAGRPVVATPQALDGIGARIGVDVLVGADEAQFAAAVCDVLLGEVGSGLGARGRGFVLRHHQWPAQLSMLDRLIAQACADPVTPDSCSAEETPL
jgi:sugar transferase (PEP-CTERM/EpsH1 system associated)